jgi:uncharacterized phage protein gp47/JayE
VADLPTRADLFQSARRSILASNAPRVNPKVVDVDGSNLNLIANSAAVVGEELSRAFQGCVQGLFGETARRAKLDRYVMDRTGGQLPRKDAKGATVALTLSRPNAVGGVGVVPVGTRVTTASGVIFSLDADVPFGIADVSVAGNATCSFTGPGGRVAAGLVNKFVDTPFDGTIVVTNAASAGGVDEEDDVRYFGRYLGFFPTIRRGVEAAIRQAALVVAGVEIATVVEVISTTGMPAAFGQLVVGDSDGNSSPAMLQSVRDSLLGFRALGIPISVLGGVIAYQPVTWQNLAYLSGYDSLSVQASLKAVTAALTQFLNPNQVLYRSDLIAAAKSVPGLVLSSNSLSVPAGDIVPISTSTILRTRQSDVTVS